MSARSEIATAASTVEGFTVTPEYRQTLKPGEGFVKWSGRARDDSGLGWIDTWQVWIAFPQVITESEKWLTDHLDALVAAIDTELVVTTATAADLILGSTATNGLIIEGTRSGA
jgi:hypothetical protein